MTQDEIIEMAKEAGFVEKDAMFRSVYLANIKDLEAFAKLVAERERVAWGVDWGKAGDIPCVSIIKRLHGGGIEVVAVEYAPYSNAHPPQRTEPVIDKFAAIRIATALGWTPPKGNT